MSLRTSLLKVCEQFRTLSGPDFADIRVNSLTIRTRTWSGNRIGLGTTSDSDLVLPPHYPVRHLTAQEIFSSSGLYETGDIIVDHITPTDGASVGYSALQLRPVITSDNVEVLYVIEGTHAGIYRAIDIRTYRPFTSQLILRRRADDPWP